jgi:hypothetical protein
MQDESIEMRERFTNRVNDFWLSLETYGELGRGENYFCSNYYAPIIFGNLQMRSERGGSVTLSSMFPTIFHGPRSDFP